MLIVYELLLAGHFSRVELGLFGFVLIKQYNSSMIYNALFFVAMADSDLQLTMAGAF